MKKWKRRLVMLLFIGITSALWLLKELSTIVREVQVTYTVELVADEDWEFQLDQSAMDANGIVSFSGIDVLTAPDKLRNQVTIKVPRALNSRGGRLYVDQKLLRSALEQSYPSIVWIKPSVDTLWIAAKRLSQKTVPVLAVGTPEYRSGHGPSGPAIFTPNLITISGPNVLLEHVQYAEVNLNGLVLGKDAELMLPVANQADLHYSQAEVAFAQQIEQYSTITVESTVEWGGRPVQVSCQLSGPLSKLVRIEEAPSSVGLSVDHNGMVEVGLEVPYVTVLDYSPKQLR